MPSRWLSVAIVAFWLAMTGWLFWHDLWPEWRPGEPPPYHIDLVEEVHKGGQAKTSWIVQRQRRADKAAAKVFNASTWVEYHQQDDTFSLHAEFKVPVRDAARVSVAKITVKQMRSTYRVNRQGQLRSLALEIDGGDTLNLGASLEGEVRDERFCSHYRLRSSDQLLEGNLEPVPVSYHGSILMPLHPVNRIHRLRPGQSWRQPLVDPFRDVFPTLPGFSGGMRSVSARVLPQPQGLPLSDGTEAVCLVIEYEDEGSIVGHTWVEQDSERVLQQEATLEGDLWIMKRDLPHKGT